MPFEQPSLRVTVGGVVIPGAVSLKIESVGYFSADRFQLGFGMGAAAFATAGYFAALGLQTITIEAALNGMGFAVLLIGQIDNIEIQFSENLAVLSGRDLSAKLIDSEISETFANQTASQIATTLAGRHQLAANVTPTATQVGQYYELDHARNALGLHSRMTTEWNLLCSLAQAENFSLSVTGTTLNFGPYPSAASVSVSPQNFISLSIDIAASLPTQAVVKSWNTRSKAASAEVQGNGPSTTLIRPNLTAAQAKAFAANHLASIRQHGTMLLGTMPADTTLMPGMALALSGTQSPLDQNYLVVAMARMLEAKSGFLQTVRAYAIA